MSNVEVAFIERKPPALVLVTRLTLDIRQLQLSGLSVSPGYDSLEQNFISLLFVPFYVFHD